MSFNNLLSSSFVRFSLGGVVTVGCEYAVFYILFVLLRWNLFLANSLSFGAGLGVSFTFNRQWAFKKAAYSKNVHHQVVMYSILAVTNLLMNNAIVWGLRNIGVNPKIGKLVAIVLIALWNFLIYRKIIFAGESESAREMLP